MTVSVLLFARYREIAGAAAIAVDVPPGATLADVWKQVRRNVHGLKDEERPLIQERCSSASSPERVGSRVPCGYPRRCR